MMKYFLLFFALFNLEWVLLAAPTDLRGKVVDHKTGQQIEAAVVTLVELKKWAITNAQGEFQIEHLEPGKYTLNTQYLGYATDTRVLEITKKDLTVEISLRIDNLALNEVVVTAEYTKEQGITSYTIGKNALQHKQMSSVSDIASLLPGGKTMGDDRLTSSSGKQFGIRSMGGENGDPTFSTGLEVDGMRLSNNGSMGNLQGVDTRNLAIENIESIEVITGVPSVEYGDVGTGVVKIKTKKGKTPFTARLAATPHTKSISLSKGFSLFESGVLNTSLERTKSVSDLASPFTSYDRNTLSVGYSNNLFAYTSMPLRISAGVNGNIGGYNSKADPDAFLEAYEKRKDYAARAFLDFNWQVNKRWLSNIEWKNSFQYTDNIQTINVNKSNATSRDVLRGTEEGYFMSTPYDKNPNAPVGMIPAGYYYEKEMVDDKPIRWSSAIKLRQHFSILSSTHSILVGMDYSGTSNKGRGVYYDNPQYTPTWRPYPFDALPSMHNFASYGEYKVSVPIGTTRLDARAGIRHDYTHISESGYKQVGAFSPRVHLSYSLFERDKEALWQSLSVKASMGKAVKLPSFSVLYPEPRYASVVAFRAPADAQGTAYNAYRIMPVEQHVNKNLRWQSTDQMEIGVDMHLGGVFMSLSAYRNKTNNPYDTNFSLFESFHYKYTDQRNLEKVSIPLAHRDYQINQSTGVVTVIDKTGVLPSELVEYTNRSAFTSSRMAANGSSILRQGLEWVVDFGKIPSLYTSIRMDGSYYYYKGVDQVMKGSPAGAATGSDGEPYPYMGYYWGGSKSFNGKERRQLQNNLSIATHIPQARVVISLRLETTLLTKEQNLSESPNGMRTYIVDGKDNLLGTPGDIYDGEMYTVTYPEYYVHVSDMNHKIPFKEKYAWAAKNDRALYNELSKMVVRSSNNATFLENSISPYFSMNLHVSKEIGKRYKLAFFANNFFHNLKRVTSRSRDTHVSLFGTGYIPRFSYGLSFEVKL